MVPITTLTTDDDDDTDPGEIRLTVTQPTWDHDNDGGTTPPITLVGANSYRVDVSDDDGETWTTEHTATRPISGSEYEHEGLKPEEELRFRFFAKKGSNYGLASDVVRDYAGNTDRPSNVRDVKAEAEGAGMIKVSWTAPEDNGGADIEQYCILANMLDEDGDVVTPAVVTTDDNPEVTRDQRNHHWDYRQLHQARQSGSHAHHTFREQCPPGGPRHHGSNLQGPDAGVPLAVRGPCAERCFRRGL